MIHDQFWNTYQLADLMFGSAGTSTYLTFIEADHTGHDATAVSARWAGGIGSNPGPVMYGPWKAFSLLAGGRKRGMSKTPLTGLELNFPWEAREDTCPWEGAFRQDNLIISCSGWENDKVDLVLALLLHWSMNYEVRLHHVGFRHKNAEEKELAMQRDEKLYLARATYRPGDNALCHFIPALTNKSPNGIFWIEHQLLPHDSKPGLHWDVATSEPECMVEFIAENSGLQPITWPRKAKTPCAVVKLDDGNGREIAIYARQDWTDIKDW